MPIRIEDDFTPDDSSRSDLINAMRKLEPYQAIVISPVDEHTRQRVYTAASRLRKAVRTKLTAAGLKVWLKDQPPKREVEQMAELPLTKEEKLANLRSLMNGEIKASPREVAQAIDDEAKDEGLKYEYDQ
jgi:hypothetical protein